MKRKIYDELLEWKEKGMQKPLMVIGARQIGKTYIIKEFCKKKFKNYIYINLFEQTEIIKIFDEEKTPYCMECDEEMFPDKEELKAELSNGPEIIYRVEKQPKDVAWRR